MKTTDYLTAGNPAERKAFFDGFRAAMSVLAGTNPVEYAHVLSHRSDGWITYLVAQLEKQQTDDQQMTIACLIDRYGYDKAMFRAFLLDRAAVNDDGIEVDPETKAPIEDAYFRLLDGQGHYSYPKRRLVDRDNPTVTISRTAYTAMSEDERQNCSRISWFDITYHGTRIARIDCDDTVYVSALLRQDILTGDPVIDRYICETGESCLHRAYLSPGRLYAYRDTVADAIIELTQDCPSCAPLYPAPLLAQIRNGDINSYGQFKLAQCLSLLDTRKLSVVKQQIFLLLNPLIDLLKFNGTEASLPNWLTKHDIISYRDANRRRFYGAEPSQKGDKGYDLVEPNVASSESILYFLRVSPIYRLALKIKIVYSMFVDDGSTTETDDDAATVTPMSDQVQEPSKDVVILHNELSLLDNFWSQLDAVDELIALCNAITGNNDRLPIQDTIDKARQLAKPSFSGKNEDVQPE